MKLLRCIPLIALLASSCATLAGSGTESVYVVEASGGA
jgi:hypothetical protein